MALKTPLRITDDQVHLCEGGSACQSNENIQQQSTATQ